MIFFERIFFFKLSESNRAENNKKRNALEELLPVGSPLRISSGGTPSCGRDPMWNRGRVWLWRSSRHEALGTDRSPRSTALLGGEGRRMWTGSEVFLVSHCSRLLATGNYIKLPMLSLFYPFYQLVRDLHVLIPTREPFFLLSPCFFEEEKRRQHGWAELLTCVQHHTLLWKAFHLILVEQEVILFTTTSKDRHNQYCCHQKIIPSKKFSIFLPAIFTFFHPNCHV